jgi:DNA-binding NtrC family response regulator
MSTCRVLIVDDDPATRRMLVEEFQDRGIGATSAEGVEQALSLLERESFSAIVSDIEMRPQSGFELLEAVSRRGVGPPVILMTAFAPRGKEREVRDAGGFALLEKPFLPAQLSEIIERAVAARPMGSPRT